VGPASEAADSSGSRQGMVELVASRRRGLPSRPAAFGDGIATPCYSSSPAVEYKSYLMSASPGLA
jgi:hypothetical protein